MWPIRLLAARTHLDMAVLAARDKVLQHDAVAEARHCVQVVTADRAVGR